MNFSSGEKNPHLDFSLKYTSYIIIINSRQYNENLYPVGLFNSKSLPAGRCWLGLGSNPTGVKFQWLIQPCLISDWLAGGSVNRYNLPLARYAAMDMSALVWDNGFIQSHMQYNKRSFTLPQNIIVRNTDLAMTLLHQDADELDDWSDSGMFTNDVLVRKKQHTFWWLKRNLYETEL